MLSLIKGCRQIKIAPTWDLELDLSPVDFVAKLIIGISVTESRPSVVYNITNPNKLKWNHLICFLQKQGYEINLVSETEWKLSLLRLVDEENALYPFLSIYLENSENQSESENAIVSSSNTFNFMNSKDLSWPSIDENFLEQYLNC